MRRYFSSFGLLRGLVDPLTGEPYTEEMLRRVPGGTPFFVEDDGALEVRLSELFRELPDTRIRSQLSVIAYSSDWLSWARFLSERRGKTVWEAALEDVQAYHRERRVELRERDPRASKVITAASWNRFVWAADRVYKLALHKGYISCLPFSHHTWVGPHPITGEIAEQEINDWLESGAREWRIRFLSLQQYKIWRDVGLRGLLPDGREDPEFRGRNGLRNASWADLSFSTGLRVSESGSFSDPEIPVPLNIARLLDPSQKSWPIKLPAPRAKRKRSRKVWLSLTWLNEIGAYRKIARSRVIQRAISRGGGEYTCVENPLLVRREAGSLRYQWVGGRGKVHFNQLSRSHVERLVEVDASGRMIAPLQLFLADDGSPLAVESWWQICQEANARCGTFGFNFEVSPHDLRHSFAVHFLTYHVKRVIGMLNVEKLSDESVKQAYLKTLYDPLRLLQLRLGHRYLETTHVYLDSVAEAQTLIDDHFESWAAESGLDLAVEEDFDQ